MSLQSLVIVLLRLLVLNFLLDLVTTSAPIIVRLADFGLPLADLFSRSALLAMFLSLAMMGGALGIWFFARPIAGVVTRNTDKRVELGRLSLADLYSLAFVSVGIFYIAGYLPASLNWAHYIFKIKVTTSLNTPPESINFYDLNSTFLPLAFGIALLINGRKWGEKLHKKHSSVHPNQAPSDSL